MQIVKINNCDVQYNSNQNFKALKIYRQEAYPWDSSVLEEFVKNKEVQKLVKIFHEKGKNIIANYRNYNKNPNEIYIKLDLLDKDKDFSKWLGKSFGEIKFSELDNFNAQTSVRAYEEREKDNIASQEKMKNALDFVEKFNSSLDKKWYQFWK